jgi:hypothetical protein
LKEKLKNELKFNLILEHRRKQKKRKLDLMQLIEILPPHQIAAFFEKQMEHAATKIQAFYRGFIERRLFKANKEVMIRRKAAIIIQKAVKYLFEYLVDFFSFNQLKY